MISRSNRVSEESVYGVLLMHAAGRGLAVHANTLAVLLGLEPATGEVQGNGAHSEVRKAVRRAVAAGYPICSGAEGYWVAETSAELHDAARRMKARGQGLIDRAEALSEAAARFMNGEGRRAATA